MRCLFLATLLSLMTATVYADNTNATFGATSTVESVNTNDTSAANTNVQATSVTTSTEKLGRTRTITISTPDRYGTIEESLTPAIHSETRYVSQSGSSYRLVGTNSQRPTEQDKQLMIPSWKVFSW
ncbi:MAG: hypothetical protein WAQ53_09705 [Thiofilum sp.]|uniref:hypothetical protein n=1 Tax=Thiofilum sp. TaxID=2212733 RepID=UPI0025ED2D1F|nr:hypothetical protein [Thiofilum sp.]MBK8453135.1 hypothetical protein [Thiofilum sp.]